jgi:hypothetical protein
MLPFFFTALAAPTVQVSAQIPVTIGVFSETYSTTTIIDPSLKIGRELNITVAANNLPPILDSSRGGLAGFDLSVSYNSTILKVVDSGFQSPYCSASDGCLYAGANNNQVIILNNTVDSANGVVRSAMIVTNPDLRVTGTGVILKIRFKVLALGLTKVSIIQNLSQLYGFSNHCGEFLSYTATDLSLDNRHPYRLVANPPSLLVSPGKSGWTNVTVSRVNYAGDGDVTLLLSGITTNLITYNFRPRTSTIGGPNGILSFSSNLTISTSPNTPVAAYHLEIVAQLSTTLNQFDQARLNFTLDVKNQIVPLLASPLPVILQTSQIPYVKLVSSGISVSPPLPLTGVFNVTGSLVAGVPLTLSPRICGGTAPFQISWEFGEGNTTTVKWDGLGNGPSITHKYASPASYQIVMTITDGAGRAFTSSQTILVSEASKASPLVGTAETGITLLALVLLIVSVLYLRRRRRSHG